MNLFKGYADKAKEKGKSVKRRAEGAAENQKLFLGEGGTGFEDYVGDAKKRKKERDEELTPDERVADQEFGELFGGGDFEVEDDEEVDDERDPRASVKIDFF